MTDQDANSAVFRGTITPCYTDLDTWRHVNNSRVYQLHLEARIQALVARFGANAWFSDSERLRPLRTITQYREMRKPAGQPLLPLISRISWAGFSSDNGLKISGNVWK